MASQTIILTPSVCILCLKSFFFLFLVFAQNACEATRPKPWEASRRESLLMWKTRPCATLPPPSLHLPLSPPLAPLSGSQTWRATPPTSRILHLTALLQSHHCPVGLPSPHLGLSNNANLLSILPFFSVSYQPAAALLMKTLTPGQLTIMPSLWLTSGFVSTTRWKIICLSIAMLRKSIWIATSV